MEVPRHYLRDHFFGVLPVASFVLARHRYYRRLRSAPATAEAAPYVDALRRDGVAVVPNLLPAEVVAGMRAAIPERAQFLESPEGDRSLMYSDAHLIPALRPFFEHPLIASVVRAYISREAVPLRRTIGLKVVAGDFPTFETNYHMDTWKQRMKVFFYLDAVSSDNAPMVYLRGSHRGLWRLWTEQRISRYYRAGAAGFADGGRDFYYLGSFWPHEVRQLKSDYELEDLTCVGAAGTAVIFDGRGLHRATPLRAGHRLILTSYWIHPRHHT
jgi:hypothetical protein